MFFSLACLCQQMVAESRKYWYSCGNLKNGLYASGLPHLPKIFTPFLELPGVPQPLPREYLCCCSFLILSSHLLYILVSQSRFHLACVASVSVWFRSKERPRNGIFRFGRATRQNVCNSSSSLLGFPEP